MVSDAMPILVGAGQLTEKLPPAEAKTPLEMMVEVAKRAAENAGVDQQLLSRVDTIAATRLALDSTDMQLPMVGKYRNIAQSVGNALGADVKHSFYASVGGNTPQMLVNDMAERISKGESDITLVVGSENMNTLMGALKQGVPIRWDDDPGVDPIPLGDNRAACTAHEKKHGLFLPINTYPLFENAIRGQRDASIEEHLQSMAKLFSGFSKVASENPYSWFPTYRTPEEIATVTEKNRYVGFPYPKYLNSVIQVDMAAGLLMMSVGTAKKLGIDPSRWVYLLGCADTKDHWNVTERVNYYSSPAMKKMAEVAFNMAQCTVDDMDFFDLYSCFPSAVEIACQEFAIAEDDPRGLTVTGGLPYFGGPGNNYVMHSIATMMDKVREKPGSKGMVNANGWFVTKHSIGIYSTEPIVSSWQRVDPKSYQAELDRMPIPSFTETPSGKGRIETYTVVHQGQNPLMGIVIGRLDDGTRFLANTPKDPALLERMKQEEFLGHTGTVVSEGGVNCFTPD